MPSHSLTHDQRALPAAPAPLGLQRGRAPTQRLMAQLRRLRQVAVLLGALMLGATAQAMPLISDEAALLTLINNARIGAGVEALQLNDAMRTAALAAAQDMAATGTLSHVGSDGKTIFNRLNDAGYTGSPFMPSGLIGQGIGSSPDALFGLWMADAASGAILTSASATEIGLGLALDGASNGYWSLVLNPVLPVAPGGGGSGSGGGGGGSGPAPTIDPAACGAGLGLLARAECLLNELRARLGLQSLAQDDALTDAARTHSGDMLAHNFLSPTGSDGSFFTDRLYAAGYDGNAVSEVIAQGFASLDAVLLAWLDEPDPRAALLNARANEFGLGLEGSGLSSRWTLTLGQGDTSAAAIPEPGALWLVLLGLCSFAPWRRRSAAATPL